MANKSPPTLADLVTQDLGYCCVEIFFAAFPNKHIVADRLGYAPDTVKKWKSRVEKGECCCSNSPKCLRIKLEKPTVRLAANLIQETLRQRPGLASSLPSSGSGDNL